MCVCVCFFSTVRVEMAITADGSLVFAVILLAASGIDFPETCDKSQTGTRQERVVTAKLRVISPAASSDLVSFI